MTLKIAQLAIPRGTRLICVSDIHGELDLFKRLLDEVGFCDDDMLILLGDIFLKGSQCHDCLKYIMEMSKKPNVHVVRGNCDWGHKDYISAAEQAWLDSLPLIIESEDFVFVHGGLKPGALSEQNVEYCISKYAFMEDAAKFDKWVMTGHWPTVNYCHEVPCNNPIINEEKRVIAIDGGNVVHCSGQLNAFIVKDGGFSWQYVDKFQVLTVKQAQPGNAGTLNITWTDRFVEIVEDGAEFSHVRHLASGKVLPVPSNKIWQDNDGNTCASVLATDHWLSVSEGDTVSIIEVFSDRIFAKKDGTMGWIWPDAIKEENNEI